MMMMMMAMMITIKMEKRKMLAMHDIVRFNSIKYTFHLKTKIYLIKHLRDVHDFDV